MTPKPFIEKILRLDALDANVCDCPGVCYI